MIFEHKKLLRVLTRIGNVPLLKCRVSWIVPTVPFIKLMFRLEELMKFKQEHPIIEEAHENILTPEDAE